MTTNTMPAAGEPKKKISVEKKMSLFGQTIPFSQAFPMVEALAVTVQIRPHGSTEENPQERHFKLASPPVEHLRCPKSGCTNGGWCIGEIMRDMISRRETHRRVEGRCNGKQWVVGPKYRPCTTHFSAEIVLEYTPAVVANIECQEDGLMSLIALQHGITGKPGQLRAS